MAIAALAVTPVFAGDVVVSVDKLPAQAQKFLTTHFANVKVVTALHDRDITDNDYTVMLDNGTKIEFDGSGKWESVKSRGAALPAGVVPAKIAEYVKAHYSPYTIEKIERKRYGYEVELSIDFESIGAEITMENRFGVCFTRMALPHTADGKREFSSWKGVHPQSAMGFSPIFISMEKN